MQVVVLLLLVAGLGLLVLGLITGSTPLVLASAAVSLLAGYAISRYRRRQEVKVPSRTASSAPAEARTAAPAITVAELAHAVAAERAGARADPAHAAAVPAEADPAHAAAEPATTGADPGDDTDAAEADPPVADTDPPLRSRGAESVWVIDGRPRYHLPGCGFLLERRPEQVPLRQAVEDGFTPCALCDPDTGLAAG